MSQATAEWAATLNVGDEVCMTGSYQPFIGKVQSTTPAQVIVNGARFWKKNGDEVGGVRYHSRSIKPLTDEIRSYIIETARRQRAENKFNALTRAIRGYSVEQLEAAIAILEPKPEVVNSGATEMVAS